MKLEVEESDYEKQRKLNIKRNEEVFKELFPNGALNFQGKSRSVPRKKRVSPSKANLILPLRKRLARSCKRKRNYRSSIKEEWSPSKKLNFDQEDDTDEEGDTVKYSDDEVSRRASSGLVIRFSKWSKRLSPGKNRLSRDSSFLDQCEDTYESDEEEFTKLKSPTRKKNVTSYLTRRPFGAVTEKDLILVAETCNEKSYDQVDGTSCHQCRQKTSDLKTVCRNDKCIGVRGQFCGPCLRNRYGESAKEAIMDPKWFCPPCRGICNCSFCMKKRGRCATGILIHKAKEKGYNDVKSFLGLEAKYDEPQSETDNENIDNETNI